MSANNVFNDGERLLEGIKFIKIRTWSHELWANQVGLSERIAKVMMETLLFTQKTHLKMQLSTDAVSLARVMKHLLGNQIRFLLTLSTLRRLPHHIEHWPPGYSISFIVFAVFNQHQNHSSFASVSRHMRCAMWRFGIFGPHVNESDSTLLHCPPYKIILQLQRLRISHQHRADVCSK